MIQHNRKRSGRTAPLQNGIDQVFINLGKTYMRTLDGFHWEMVSTMEVASGGIGLKTQQMKAWLERVYLEESN